MMGKGTERFMYRNWPCAMLKVIKWRMDGWVEWNESILLLFEFCFGWVCGVEDVITPAPFSNLSNAYSPLILLSFVFGVDGMGV